jgi:hypothetical protein
MKTATTTTLKDITSSWLDAQSKERGEPRWLTDLRLSALRQYEALPFPGKNDERWKRLDLSVLNWDNLEFKSEIHELGGGWVSLRETIKSRPDLIEDAWRKAIEGAEKNKFLSFILAVAPQAACLIVPKGSKKTAQLSLSNIFQLNFLFIKKNTSTNI